MKKKAAESTNDKDLLADYEKQIADRTAALLPVYHTVAVNFADLHDTPDRMLEKGCINDIVPWRRSRHDLFWRLRRLILEDYFVKRILAAQDNLSVGQAQSMLRRWFIEDRGTTEAYVWDKNDKIVEWLESQKEAESTLHRNIASVKKDAIISQIQNSLVVSRIIL